MPEGAVYVGRGSPWGNPWSVAGARRAGFQGTDAELSAMCVAFFRRGEAGGLPALNGMGARIPSLRGKTLACWCRLDHPCHADVLLDLANAPLQCDPADA